MHVSSGGGVQVARHSTSVMNELWCIVAEGGVGALFRGLQAATIRVIPMALVSFGTYEVVRSHYVQLEESWALAAAEKEAKLCSIASKEISCDV
jgi:hypothetical protein